ncbi:hypothetical protein [Gynurincola endophyticus]|jgi:zinc protease|uniref:hypothetical protein n=1 Tax=Gynurincola endophyticus TaxID=2479004 RepID=UPI000F8F45A5|nr:hypothetical protein [Gynurincola endophyticus]
MKRVLFVLCATVMSSVVFAQDAKSLVDKYYNALGGKSAETNIKSYVANIEMDAMGQPLNVKQSVVLGESSKIVIDAGIMEIIQVWSKGKGWMTNPMTGGTEDISEDQAVNLVELLNLFGYVHPSKVDDTFKYIGKKEVGGETFEGIETVKSGNDVKIYFDNKGYLRLQEINSAEGSVTIEFSDYRDLDFGFKAPFKVITNTPMASIEMKYKDFLINEKIDPAIFEKP